MPADLFLVAGLPHPLHTRAQKFLEHSAGLATKVIAVPSSSLDDDRLYRRTTINSLLEAGGAYVLRQQKVRSDDQAARPRRITLLYVPSQDEEPLIGAFDFFVFPIALRALSSFDKASGSQRRHQWPACQEAIVGALDYQRLHLVQRVQRKIDARSPKEPLLLPPRNFALPEYRMRTAFVELIRGSRNWDNAIPEIPPAETFTSDRLPGYLRPKERRVLFKDSRGIVFPCARPNEMHGLRSPDSVKDIKALREMLQSTYRFGVSLPQGFHHDAQLESGKLLDRTKFDCCQKGEVLVSGSHANVYPDDFVRPAPQK